MIRPFSSSPGSATVETVISATYDYRLVALPVLIAIGASYTALDLAGRVTAAQNNARLAWLFGGAISMGTGIWSMHYTGMLAYRLPVPVYYPEVTEILGQKVYRRVADIPDRRIVDPREYEKEADYVLNNLSEIPALVSGAKLR